MRDLGNQSFFSGRKNKSMPFEINRRTILIATAIVFVVLVGYFLLSGRGSSAEGSSSGDITLKDASTSLKPVALSGAAKIEGIDLKTETASMRDVKFGGDASARVSRSYGGGIYKLDVSATLPDPKNTYYEVWLVGSGKPVAVDFMSGSKTSWSLSISDSDKFSSYKTVWITLERTKDSLPEEHVMEGSF